MLTVLIVAEALPSLSLLHSKILYMIAIILYVEYVLFKHSSPLLLLLPLLLPHSGGPTDAQRTLLMGLRGRLSALARDRTGSHLLLKLWHTADATAQKAIVSELAAAASAGLAAAAEAHPGGRAVMRECMVERFSRYILPPTFFLLCSTPTLLCTVSLCSSNSSVWLQYALWRLCTFHHAISFLPCLASALYRTVLLM
jgi:hypothetical protein